MTITLTADWISDISPYSVGDAATDTITATQLTRFLGIVEDRIVADGVSDKEHMIALLVCDVIYRKTNDITMMNEKIGADYSYTKSMSTTTVGRSPYLVDYEQRLEALGLTIEQASEGVERADATNDWAKLDQADLPTMG